MIHSYVYIYKAVLYAQWLQRKFVHDAGCLNKVVCDFIS